jgi:hypothetical protein
VQKPKRKPPYETPNILEVLNNPNCMHEEILSRLNSKNAYYHGLRGFFLSRLLPKYVKVKQKTMVNSFIKRDLNLFFYFFLRRKKTAEENNSIKEDDAGYCIMRSSVIYIPRYVLCDNRIKRINWAEDKRCMADGHSYRALM